ncbi:MAG: hypothetical protein ACFCVA_09710 [Gammaproteobacteria bacterium]
MHEGRDIWWKVEPHSDDRQVAQQVGTAWSMFGRPWLERVATLAGAREELLRQKMYLQAAAVCVLLDEVNEARELVEKAQKRQPLAKDRIHQWAKVEKLV